MSPTSYQAAPPRVSDVWRMYLQRAHASTFFRKDPQIHRGRIKRLPAVACPCVIDPCASSSLLHSLQRPSNPTGTSSRLLRGRAVLRIKERHCASTTPQRWRTCVRTRAAIWRSSRRPRNLCRSAFRFSSGTRFRHRRSSRCGAPVTSSASRLRSRMASPMSGRPRRFFVQEMPASTTARASGTDQSPRWIQQRS